MAWVTAINIPAVVPESLCPLETFCSVENSFFHTSLTTIRSPHFPLFTKTCSACFPFSFPPVLLTALPFLMPFLVCSMAYTFLTTFAFCHDLTSLDNLRALFSGVILFFLAIFAFFLRLDVYYQPSRVFSNRLAFPDNPCLFSGLKFVDNLRASFTIQPFSNKIPQVFHPGCKVVLGSGPGQETRFATAVVGAAEASGAEFGGSIVLESSLALNHGDGIRVAAARPGRVEAANYRKRQVGYIALDSSISVTHRDGHLVVDRWRELEKKRKYVALPPCLPDHHWHRFGA